MALKRHLPLLPAAASLLAPIAAHAQALVQTTSIFNIFVGLMLVAALLTYGVGAVIWVTRLNSWPSFRTEGTKILEWAVVILFVLVVLLGIVQFFRDHPHIATYTTAVLVVLIVGWVLVKTFAQGGEDEKKAGH